MFAKSLIKKFLYFSGSYHLRCRLQPEVNHRLLIVMYHDLVVDGDQEHDWTKRIEPTASQFRAQLEVIRKRARVISVGQAVREIREHGRLKERSIAITFDDGLESVYTLGYPILKEFGVPATIYLPTNWINGKMSFWWQSLADTLKLIDGSKVSTENIFECLGLEAPPNSPRLSYNSNRLPLMVALEERLRTLPTAEADARVNRLSELPTDSNLGAKSDTKPMTWNQIREMASNGVSFGAHTVTHPNMVHIDALRAESEFRDSKAEIENQIGKTVVGLAFPYGTDYSAYSALSSLLEKVGYEYALTAVTGFNDHNVNRYLMRRVSLPLTTSPSLIGREVLLDFMLDNDEMLRKFTA